MSEKSSYLNITVSKPSWFSYLKRHLNRIVPCEHPSEEPCILNPGISDRIADSGSLESCSSLPLDKFLLRRYLDGCQNCLILCIGTDRLIGDSLGPLTGSLLTRTQNPSIIVYGTLENTVHACNLTNTLADIRKKHPDSVVIAVDASLSHEYPAGTILIRPGSLKPGMGVQKDLPAVGDISITGITGIQSREPYLTLQTTRLSLIMSMAEQICTCITSVCC